MARLKSGLVIPASVTSVKPPIARCRVLIDEAGTMCNTPLYSPADVESHVTACARRNLEHIQAQSKRVRMPGFFGPDAADRELEEWVAKHKTAIIEGRKSIYGKSKKRKRSKRKRR
jgi:hypothetical protein